MNQNVLYHFATSVIVNRILLKTAKILVSIIFYSDTVNFTEKLYRKTVSDKNCLFFSLRVLRIFSEFSYVENHC